MGGEGRGGWWVGGEAADTKNGKATEERAAAEEETITEYEVEEEEGEEETELEARAPPGKGG